MHDASVTIFPSITPAATAALITGAYPAENGIVGASWYDRDRDEIAYYGDDFWVIAAKGVGAFMRDFLVHLNGDRLTAPTLFELIEGTGREAASLNYLVHRGLEQHRVHVPRLLAMLPGVSPVETVKGPHTLCLGDFVSDGRARRHQGPRGALHRFGMDDAATATLLCEMVAANALPDFTVAYFADNDYRSHEVGPHEALPVLERIDETIGRMFDAAGGAERFLAETAVILTSDHGQSEIGSDKAAAIVPLHEVFSEFRQAKIGTRWAQGDEILICPNMRAAQIYVRDEREIERVARAALVDERIDLILWQIPGDRGAVEYHVIGPLGAFTFWREHTGKGDGRDAFGTAWGWRGDTEVLRLDTDAGLVDSREYPNALERIAGALDARNSGDVWLTVRPGCEFAARGSPPHLDGGSHGALHALDSLSPVIAAGGRRLPRTMRSVDVAAWCMEACGVKSARRSAMST